MAEVLRSMLAKRFLGVILALSLFSMSTYAIEDKVIYGTDDRLDLFEVSNPLFLELANSTAAMITTTSLQVNGNKVSILGKNLRSRGICQGEKFAEQMTSANCSGFLVGKDLVVTAGHCVRSARDCETNAWVFDYALKATEQNAMTFDVPKSSVYRCKEIVDQVLDSSNMNDYALLRLDRQVLERKPLKFRTSGKVADRTEILVIGHPTGLPTKVADNAVVRSNGLELYFVTNLDTFGGNSGSAVFDARTGLVEGILVRGETDYEYDFSRGCKAPKVCATEDCRGEDVTRITNIKKLMAIAAAEASPVVETPVVETPVVVVPVEVPVVTVTP